MSPPRKPSRRDNLERLAHISLQETLDGVRQRRLILALWELPLDVQAGLVTTLALRELEVFDVKYPGLHAMSTFLRAPHAGHRPQDPVAELAACGEELDRRGAYCSDNHLFSAARLLKEGLMTDATPETTTCACVEAALYVVAARWRRAWLEHDPVAATADDRRREWMDSPHAPEEVAPFTLKDPGLDTMVQRARREAWGEIIAWLRSKRVDEYPEVVERSRLARLLRRAYGELIWAYPNIFFYRW